MAAPDAFVAACEQAARQMRRLPADVRRALAQRMRDEVAEPLAADIRAAWRGPYATALATATKARSQADPTIVVGGARPVVSGGASPRELVYGVEFGGGRRRGFATSSRGRRYARRTTMQFPAGGQHAVFGTVEDQLPELLDKVAGIVLDTFESEVTNGGS